MFFLIADMARAGYRINVDIDYQNNTLNFQAKVMLGILAVDILSFIAFIAIAIIGFHSNSVAWELASAMCAAGAGAHLLFGGMWAKLSEGESIKLARDLIVTAVSFNPHNPHFYIPPAPPPQTDLVVNGVRGEKGSVFED